MSFKEYIHGRYRRLLYLRREWIAYYYQLFKQDSPTQQRVVIFGQGRTGSTLLEDLLYNTGHFQKYGELFHRSRGKILFPRPFIRGLAKKRGNQNFIFHVKIYQLVRDRHPPEDPARFLRELYDSGWKIIYLSRRNSVKHVLSNYLMEARSASHKFNNNNENIELEIDPDRFIRLVDQRKLHVQEELEALKGLDYIKIVYEDDLEKQEFHQATIDRILDELNLERTKVETSHRKVNNIPLRRLIKNYDQFKTSLTKSGLGNFL